MHFSICANADHADYWHECFVMAETNKVYLCHQRGMFLVCLAHLMELCSSWRMKSSRETTTSTRKCLLMQSWWVINPMSYNLHGNMLKSQTWSLCELFPLLRLSTKFATRAVTHQFSYPVWLTTPHAPSSVFLCQQNALEYITMAALSKIFAVVTTYPYQVVRARLQDQHNTYNGVLDVIRRTWR